MAIHSRNRFNSWLPALFDGEFKWDFLRPAWQAPTIGSPNGTKIEPMDFDAVVERRGHFLIFETKVPGKEIDLGQRITLTQQWKKGASIFVVSGKQPEDIDGLCVYAENTYKAGLEIGGKPLGEADVWDVVYRARCWFCWASGAPIPKREEWDNQLWRWDYDRGDQKQ